MHSYSSIACLGGLLYFSIQATLVLMLGGLDAAAVCDAGYICGDDPQYEIVFPLLECPDPTP